MNDNISIELILDEFKKHVDAGDKLKEIVPIDKNNGQIRTEYNDFTIQLYWKIENNNKINLISYKQKKELVWTIQNIDILKNSEKEKIETKFNEIKRKLIHKKIMELMRNSNKNLRAIRLILYDGREIKKRYDKNITKLTLSHNGISKIKGLDRFINLEELCLWDNNIEDIKNIEGLDKLINLKEIDLSKNKIKKIEGLDKLVNLTELYLYENKISVIENIDKLINLTTLYLSCNNIKKIEGLDKLINLKNLDLRENKLTKIENLENLINLEQLHLDICNFWDDIIYYGNSHLEINNILRHIDKWEKDYISIFKENKKWDDVYDEKVEYTDKDIKEYKKYIFKKRNI